MTNSECYTIDQNLNTLEDLEPILVGMDFSKPQEVYIEGLNVCVKIEVCKYFGGVRE